MKRNSPEFYQYGPNSEIDVSRKETGSDFIEFMSRSGILEKLESPESRKDFVDTLKPEEYQDMLIRINGILRGEAIKDREFDGDGVTLSGFNGESQPPKQEDKLELIKESLQAGKKLDNLSEEALMLATVLVAAHPFADGNGRTARTLYHLIKEGVSQDKIETLKTLVDEYGRYEINVNPGFISFEIEKFQQHELLKEHMQEIELKTYPNYLFYDRTGYEFQNSVSDQKIQEIKDIINDGFYGFVAFSQFLDEDRWKPNYTKTFYDSKTGEALRTPIIIEEVAPDLSESDIDEILEKYWKVKKEHVEHMIKMFTEPEKYESPDSDFDTLKDYYTHRVETSKLE